MKVRFFNIDWDTEDDEVEEERTAEECGLPKEVVLDMADDADPEEEGADELSNNYGFCVNGCEFEVLPASADPHQDLIPCVMVLRAGTELIIFLNHPTDVHSHYQATTKLFMV